MQFSPATAVGMSESNRHKEIVMKIVELGEVLVETKGQPNLPNLDGRPTSEYPNIFKV